MSTRGSRRPSIGVVRLEAAADLPLPAYQSEQAAGLDLLAAVPADTPVVLKPRQRALVPTGLILELPKGTEAQVRPRSGLAMKHGITVLNSPGTIDSDYRGEVKVLLVNLGDRPFTITRGERIAQMVIATHISVRLVERKQARATLRGAGGFGSTGTRTEAGAVPGKPSPKRSPGKAAKPVTSSVANRKAVAAKAKPTKPRRR